MTVLPEIRTFHLIAEGTIMLNKLYRKIYTLKIKGKITFNIAFNIIKIQYCIATEISK